MKKIHLLALPLLFSAAAVMAQNAPTSGISESTDPSKVSEVERRAQEIRSAQGASGSSSGSSMSGSSMSGEGHKARHGMHKRTHGAHHRGMHGQGQSGMDSSQK
jgi:hypothetical protein